MKGLFYPGAVSQRRELVMLCGRLNLGSTGAITAQTKKRLSGFVAARTAAGTYTITLTNPYCELVNLKINIIGANSTYTAAAGRQYFITSDLTTTTGVITLKFLRTDTGAVAEIEDNAKVLITLLLAQSPSEVA